MLLNRLCFGNFMYLFKSFAVCLQVCVRIFCKCIDPVISCSNCPNITFSMKRFQKIPYLNIRKNSWRNIVQYTVSSEFQSPNFQSLSCFLCLFEIVLFLQFQLTLFFKSIFLFVFFFSDCKINKLMRNHLSLIEIDYRSSTLLSILLQWWVTCLK